MHYTNRYPGPLWINVGKYTKRMKERQRQREKLEQN